MGETHVFQTVFSKYFSMAFAGVTGLASVYLAFSDVGELTASVPILLAVGILVWLLFGHPRLEVSDGGITLVNIVHTIHIPWNRFVGVHTKWNLRIVTDGEEYTSWALPVSSGTARRLPRRRGAKQGSSHEVAGGPAETAALVIGGRFKEIREAGYLDRPPLDPPQVSIRVTRAALVGAGSIAALVLIAVL